MYFCQFNTFISANSINVFLLVQYLYFCQLNNCIPVCTTIVFVQEYLFSSRRFRYHTTMTTDRHERRRQFLDAQVARMGDQGLVMPAQPFRYQLHTQMARLFSLSIAPSLLAPCQLLLAPLPQRGEQPADLAAAAWSGHLGLPERRVQVLVSTVQYRTV